MLNSIFWGNEADGAGTDPDDQVYFDANSVADVLYSCVQDDSQGGTVPYSATNIDEDPNFIDAPAGNYRLQSGLSHAIDAGSNSLLYPYGVFAYSDLDGDMRIQNGTVDMGCYEDGEEPACLFNGYDDTDFDFKYWNLLSKSGTPAVLDHGWQYVKISCGVVRAEFKVEDSDNCSGFNDKRQWGECTFEIDVPYDGYPVTLMVRGRTEKRNPGYDRGSIFVERNEVMVQEVFIDSDEHDDGTSCITEENEDKTVTITLDAGITTVEFRADTVDSVHHTDCYFDFTLAAGIEIPEHISGTVYYPQQNPEDQMF